MVKSNAAATKELENIKEQNKKNINIIEQTLSSQISLKEKEVNSLKHELEQESRERANLESVIEELRRELIGMRESQGHSNRPSE